MDGNPVFIRDHCHGSVQPPHPTPYIMADCSSRINHGYEEEAAYGGLGSDFFGLLLSRLHNGYLAMLKLSGVAVRYPNHTLCRDSHLDTPTSYQCEKGFSHQLGFTVYLDLFRVDGEPCLARATADSDIL